MSKNKKIEAILFSDLHLNDINKDICYSFINKLLKFVEEKQVPRIIFLGDFIDYRQGPSEVTLNAAHNIFRKIAEKYASIFYYIPGNHDKFIEDGESSYLELFTYLCPNLYRNIKFIKGDKYNYCFFPYFEGKLFEENLNALQDTKLEIVNTALSQSVPTILFSHYMYEQIPIEIKNKFKKIFLGHNHEREDFPNGMYIGSCFQQGFFEDTNKGFTILYDDLSTELVQFISDREFVLQKIDINTFDEKQIKNFIEDFIIKNPTKILKIEFCGYNKDISNLKEFCKQKNISYSCKIDNNIVDESNNILNISQFSSNQIKIQFENFCKENNINKDIKNKLLKFIDNGK